MADMDVGRSIAPASAAELADLDPAQRAWLVHDEFLWRQAHAIVEQNARVDPGDVYHARRRLELSPSARLRQSFQRARLRAHRR